MLEGIAAGHPWRMMRTPWMISCVDGDRGRGLDDLEIGVVGRPQHGRPFISPGDAAFGEIAVLGGLGGIAAAGGFLFEQGALLAGGGQGRQFAVRRIENDGGSEGGCAFGIVLALPDHVVVMDIVFGLAVFLLDALLLPGGGFGFGEELFGCQFGGALEGRECGVGPVAFEAGVAVGGARRRPDFGGGHRKRDDDQGGRESRDHPGNTPPLPPYGDTRYIPPCFLPWCDMLTLMVQRMAVFLAMAGSAFAAVGDCDRACLKGMLDQYLNAVIKHDPAAAPLFIGFRETDNAVVTRPGTGVWKTVTGLGKMQRRYIDPVDRAGGVLPALWKSAANSRS